MFMSKPPASVLTPGAEDVTGTSPTHVPLLTDGVTTAIRSTLDLIAPLKKTIRKQKRPLRVTPTRPCVLK